MALYPRRQGWSDVARMTLHYHGTPITPTAKILRIAGRCFCVSFVRPDQVKLVHQFGQSVLLDPGAFSAKTLGIEIDWALYYAFCDVWLDYPTTWAIIPDVIDAGVQLQDALLREWPHGERGAPVWHMDEPIERLLNLLDRWPRVCIGSTAEYWVVESPAWERRMDEVWNSIVPRHRRTPWVHMLRGGKVRGKRWPFASTDSVNVGQNCHSGRPHNNPEELARRIEAANCPARFTGRQHTQELFGQWRGACASTAVRSAHEESPNATALPPPRAHSGCARRCAILPPHRAPAHPFP